MAATRYVVHGVVQGVGFRWFVLREARRLELVGWVRNLADGSVEVVADGEATAIAQLREALGHGPDGSVVQNVEISAVAHEITLSNIFTIK